MIERFIGGRMGRRHFLWSQAVILLGSILLIGLVLVIPVASPDLQITLLMAVFAAALIPQALYSVRRLHDLNHSGWWATVIVVPYVSLALFIYLMVKNGSLEPNRFGPADTRRFIDSLLNR